MSKNLDNKIYADRIIKCSCNKLIGRVVMDAQVLILESGLILYNCAFWKCNLCSKNGKFIAPLLPNEKIDFDSELPDTKQLKTKAVELAKQFGYTAKDKQTDTQPQNHFSAS